MMTPIELLEAYSGKVSLLSRCILFGIVEPNVDINLNIQVMLANSLIEDLGNTKKETPIKLLDRMEKAVRWAIRNDVPDDLGIFVGLSALQLLGRNKLIVFKRSDAYSKFYEKFGSILEENDVAV